MKEEEEEDIEQREAREKVENSPAPKEAAPQDESKKHGVKGPEHMAHFMHKDTKIPAYSHLMTE